MFGLATEDFIRVYVGAKIDVLTKRIDEALIEVARGKHVPVMTPKPEPKPVELYTAKVWIADRQGTEMSYSGVSSVSRGNGYDNSDVLRLYGADGKCKAELTGGYSYSLTEQKPEGEKASFDYGGVSWFSQIDRRIDRLLDQPVNVRSLTLAREELERKMAKNHDALNHRIEMLELRLDKTDSVKKPNRKPKSK